MRRPAEQVHEADAGARRPPRSTRTRRGATFRRTGAALRVPLACAATALAAAVLASCGGSTPSGHPPAPSAAARALYANAVERDAVAHGAAPREPAPGTGGNAENDDNPGSADEDRRGGGAEPCELVSRAEAEAITGAAVVSVHTAPLGPTCIYVTRGSAATITLAVEAVDAAKVLPLMQQRKRVAVGGRSAYCGVYGGSTTIVPLAGGQALTVAAPCRIGTRFAAKALPRLAA